MQKLLAYIIFSLQSGSINRCILLCIVFYFSIDVSYSQTLYKSKIDQSIYKTSSRGDNIVSRIEAKVNNTFRNLDSIWIIDYRSAKISSSEFIDAERRSGLKYAEYFSFNSNIVNRISLEKPEAISVVLEFKGKVLKLDLVVADLFTSEFEFQSNKFSKISGLTVGNSYQGILRGEHSVVSYNIFKNEVSSIISSQLFGNITIGKLQKNISDIHFVFSEKDKLNASQWSCGLGPIEGKIDKTLLIPKSPSDRSEISPCLKLFWETRYDIYEYHGFDAQAVSNYVITIFSHFNLIYSNEDIGTRLNIIFIWTEEDIYVDCSSNNLVTVITTYSNLRSNIILSDLALLLMADGGQNGIAAGYGGLCNNSYSIPAPILSPHSVVRGVNMSIPPPYVDYVWPAYATAHETGHNLGSRHTHACVWNDNFTAIDGCRAPEDDCPQPDLPPNGGTIMSYCHDVPNVGVNFSNGFGPQPSEVIQYVASYCVDYECDNPPNTCTDDFEPNNTYTIAPLFFADPLGEGIADSGEDGNIGYVDDVDWFKIVLETSGDLSISLDSFPYNYDIEVYGPDGTNAPALAGSYNSGTQAESILLQTTQSSATNYYVKVYSFIPNNYSNASCYYLRCLWTSCPDLIVIDQTSSAGHCYSGDQITLSLKEKNLGRLPAGPNYVSFHLSSNNILTPGLNGDTYLDEYFVDQTIPPQEQTMQLSKEVLIPASTNPGTYYLFFSADGAQVIDECDELNNFASVIITVSDSAVSSESAYRYWFNGQFSEAITVNHTLGNTFLLEDSISTTNLPPGLQTFNMAFKDDEDLWSSTISSIFLKLTTTFPAGSARYDYWFDNNFNSRILKTITSTSNLLLIRDINTGSLNPGLHSFTIRLKPDGKHWSSTISSLFYKVAAPFPVGLAQYEYWFDQNYVSKINLSISNSANFLILDSLTTTSISPGLHSFNIRFKPDGRHWSTTISNLFYKLDTSHPVGSPHFEYWFDSNYSGRVVDSIANTANLFILDSLVTTGLSPGLHAFHFRSKPQGAHWSSTTSDLFYKAHISSDSIVRYQYWFDSDIQDSVSVEIAPTTIFFLETQLDSLSIPNGLHSFHSRFRSYDGKWSSVTSDLFYKKDTLILNNKITRFVYWYDNDWQNAQTIVLPGLPNDSLTIYVNAEHLPEGEHSVHMFFREDGPKWSSVVSSNFEKDSIQVSCPIDSKTFSSGIPGALAYQWQVDTGSGFADLINGSVYSGVASDTLQLSGAPTSWYGNLYRCIITTPLGQVTGETYTLRFSLVWDGSESDAWENPLNWSCEAVPDGYTDVYIRNGTPNSPEVNSITSCRYLHLSPGAQVTMISGNNLTVTGYNQD